MERTDANVDEHLASLPDEVREDMQTLDAMISEVMDGTGRVLYTGTFWGGSDQEIIGYGPYIYERPNGVEVDWFVIGLAVQKNYLSMYVSAVDDGEYLSKTQGSKLGKVKIGASSISFKSADDLDLNELRSFVQRARDLSSDYLDAGL
ncbi:MAG: DUF1801 domain-containing protein [Acidimicrobiia bacterium]